MIGTEDNAMDDRSHAGVFGSWRAVSATVELADTGEVMPLYGVDPVGRLVIGADGLWTVVMTAADRRPPETDADRLALFATLTAYAGRYRIEGDRFVTRIEVAWHPEWVGTEQVRFFALDGDVLTLRTPEMTYPTLKGRRGIGVITWQRET